MINKLALLVTSICAIPCAAADVSPPRLTNPGTWLTKREPPPNLLKRGERALTWLALDISPEGLQTGCTIRQSSGFPTLDDYACDLFKQNGHFVPARDRSGNAAPGMSERYLVWEASKNATDADTSKASTAKAGGDVATWVSSDDLPPGIMRPDEIIVSSAMLSVSADGRVIRCEIRFPSARPELDRRACALLILRGHYEPAHDASGNRTQGVDWRQVRWQVPKD